MSPASNPLLDLLKPSRLTSVVDIGANPIVTDGAPPYSSLLSQRLCTLTGFEPQEDALATLNQRKSDLETYLPYAVGDGKRGTLNICHAPGMTSLLTPNPRTLSCFPNFIHFGAVTRQVEIDTRTLDSIKEITALDYLKIDVQGGELAVFTNGKEKLSQTVAIQTEVSFVPFYKDQPVFGQIDLALRAMGFIPHMQANLNKRMVLPLMFHDQPYASLNQVIEADMVYVRDFTAPETISDEQFKHLAIVAHYAYASYDLAMRCVDELVKRNAIAADGMARYLEWVKAG